MKHMKTLGVIKNANQLRRDKTRKLIFVAICMVFALFLILMGPLDLFRHGEFSVHLEYAQLSSGAGTKEENISTQGVKQIFTPQKRHCKALKLYLIGLDQTDPGQIILDIYKDDGQKIDSISKPFKNLSGGNGWQLFEFKKELIRGQAYSFLARTEGSRQEPKLTIVEPGYLTDEVVDGGVFSAYVYATSTFSFSEKVFFFIFIVAVLLFVHALLFAKTAISLRRVSLFICLIGVMGWNFQFNSMDSSNDRFKGFQADSETLVTGPIMAQQRGIWMSNPDDSGFSLGRYTDLYGAWSNYDQKPITNENWNQGYAVRAPQIVLAKSIGSDYVNQIAAVGNSVRFKNGDVFKIIDVTAGEANIQLTLDAKKPLNPYEYGPLNECVFLKADLTPLPAGELSAYRSQYGIQGKVFRNLAEHINDKDEIVPRLNLLCSILTAFVLVMVSYLAGKKYNPLMGGTFFVTFWLSPWVVNFARNLYWLEFTWFAPMAVGLLCSWKQASRKIRWLCYVGAFITIWIKSLCGYEYMTTIMLGLVVFLLADFIRACFKKDKLMVKSLAKTILAISFFAIAGFVLTIYMHAILRGHGDLILGLKLIKSKMLSRTFGADLSDFPPSLWASFNASVWEVVRKYFHFDSDIIVGVEGQLFPILCVLPLFLFYFDWQKKRLNTVECSLYLLTLIATISWFILGKAHSYVHTHMNYVLWYFGFVQICFYLPIKFCLRVLKQKHSTLIKEGGHV